MSSRPGASKPRILFFIPSLTVGGAERHTVTLCDQLHARGYPTSILVHGSCVSPVLASLPSAAGAHVLGLKGMSDLRGWATIWLLLRRMRPDVIVAVNQTPFIVAALQRLAHGTRARLACIFHTTELQPYEKYQERLFIRLSRFADLLVFVSERQRVSWEAKGANPARSLVITNGVDAPRFAAARSTRNTVRDRLGVPANAYLLGILASFRVEKNHGELVEALAVARDAGIDAQLLCIGDGPMRGEVEGHAARLGVTGRLIFTGELANVAPLLAACDVGVLCSTIETFPLSALEFLAAGVPMIAADVGGITEIVRHQANGLVYSGGNVSDLASTIATLASPARRACLAAAAAESVAAFSIDRMVDRYAEEFDALARN